jgi:ketosteroid isomerase-like protein
VAEPGHGNYFSIWKRQPSGRWRVYIDVGTKTPGEVLFAPGFVRAVVDRRYAAGRKPAEEATQSVLAADAALNAAIARDGAASAYARVATPATRLHRNGSGAMPAVGAAAIARWFGEHPSATDAVTGGGEASRAGDLGYTYGTLDAGAYIRMWARRADGAWLLQIDATVPAG